MSWSYSFDMFITYVDLFPLTVSLRDISRIGINLHNKHTLRAAKQRVDLKKI